MEEYDYLFKILLVGDEGCGKTSILMRYVKDTFQEDLSTTVGVDFDVRTVNHSGDAIRIQIWDTAGQERFHTIVSSYYRGAHAIVILFSLTDMESFEHLEAWLNNVKRYSSENVDILILANKCDCAEDRIISQETVQEYAKKVNVTVIETSAKDCINVEEAFMELVKNIHTRVSCINFDGPIPLDMDMNNDKPSNSKHCCNVS